MKSTTRPTSRKTACIITPATWRWCARTMQQIPVVLSSATPSVETEVNARRGRYRRLHLPERFGGQHLPPIEAIDLRREGPPRGRFIAPRLAEAVKIALERSEQALLFLNRRGYAPLTLVPRLRPSLGLPELRCLAGRSPLQAAAGLPSLRLLACRRRRPARNAHATDTLRRRSGRASSGWRKKSRSCFPARACSCCPAISWNRSSACARNSTTSPKAASTSSSARSSWPRAIISRSSIWSASSMPISALPTAIRARPSARSSCCIRWSGRAGREEGRGLGFLQTHQPEHPVMRALISRDREAFYDARDRRAREDRLSAVRPAREPASSPAATSTRPKALRASSRRSRRSTKRCACSARPKRRSPWCAAAIASACW